MTRDLRSIEHSMKGASAHSEYSISDAASRAQTDADVSMRQSWRVSATACLMHVMAMIEKELR